MTTQSPPRPTARAPLPVQELREAAAAVSATIGPRRAARDAVSLLAPRELDELAGLLRDRDLKSLRRRARAIASGSLGARLRGQASGAKRVDPLGKAIAAQTLADAPVENLEAVLLDKEEAAMRAARQRAGRRRDEDKRRREQERSGSEGRATREQLALGQDGQISAKIRIVVDPRVASGADTGDDAK
jgi:hypothetical protein